MADARPLLERLLNTPDLAKIVPQLQPQVLHRVIERCGLEDSAELVALATPEQIARVLDVDVWRVRAPGADEAFDADRFGLWIAVLMESGARVAAEKLRGLDIDLVVVGFARHAAVYDAAAVSPYTTLDGQLVPGRSLSGPSSNIHGYVIEAKRMATWEAIVDLLEFLAVEHPEYFHRVMRRCVRLSDGGRERDGFHNLLEDDEQDLFDLATGREARREQQGYVAPAQAHAFLRDARALRLDADPPRRSPIAGAYFRALESTETTDGKGTHESRPATPSDNSEGGAAESDADAIADVVEILREEGVLARLPMALLGAGEGQASRLPFVEAYGIDHPASTDDLAYLANVMMSGCSVQARPFTPQEASDVALAICNLGLENWPSQWPAGDLVGAFQVGWRLLYRTVCMDAAEKLITVLAEIRCTDRDIQLRLDGLRRELVRHTRDGEPWRARNDLDVILTLDAVAWAALLGLIDECPVMHGALRASRRVLSINPTDFEFISQNSHITTVHDFLAALPSILSS